MMILFYSLAIILLILFPSDTARTAYHALQLWGESIAPVLFPYMVFSRLLCSKLNNLRLPAFPVVAILGLLGGSPSGAASVSANADKLSQRKTLILCTLTGTVSPMFILGTLQPWVQHPLLCRRLLWCHWLSALLSSWLIFLFSKGNLPSIVKTSDKNAVPFDPIMQSVDAVLQVGGCVILYSVLARKNSAFLFFFAFFISRHPGNLRRNPCNMPKQHCDQHEKHTPFGCIGIQRILYSFSESRHTTTDRYLHASPDSVCTAARFSFCFAHAHDESASAYYLSISCSVSNA